MSLLRNVSLFHQIQSNKFIFWCKFVRHADKNRLLNNLSSGFVPKKVLQNIRTNLFNKPAYRRRLLFITDVSSLFDERKLPDHDIDLEVVHLSDLSNNELRSFARKLSHRRAIINFSISERKT